MALPHEGKVAIVTGSTEGAWPGTIGETAALVEKEGRRALALKMDVTSDEDVANVVEATIREFGRIDILVNNAGITGNDAINASEAEARFIGGNPALLDTFYRVNVRGPYVLSQIAAAHMEKAGGVWVRRSPLRLFEGRTGPLQCGPRSGALPEEHRRGDDLPGLHGRGARDSAGPGRIEGGEPGRKRKGDRVCLPGADVSYGADLPGA
jgi:NAD(P)-dependent dehydrogenase (short-subunit alcohol dehydrogenase family)